MCKNLHNYITYIFWFSLLFYLSICCRRFLVKYIQTAGYLDHLSGVCCRTLDLSPHFKHRQICLSDTSMKVVLPLKHAGCDSLLCFCPSEKDLKDTDLVYVAMDIKALSCNWSPLLLVNHLKVLSITERKLERWTENHVKASCHSRWHIAHHTVHSMMPRSCICWWPLLCTSSPFDVIVLGGKQHHLWKHWCHVF